MVHESGAQLPGPGVGLDLNGVTIDKTCRVWGDTGWVVISGVMGQIVCWVF